MLYLLAYSGQADMADRRSTPAWSAATRGQITGRDGEHLSGPDALGSELTAINDNDNVRAIVPPVEGR